MTFSTVKDIRAWRLCVGCGACAYICPKKQIELVDVIDEGIRPIVKGISCGSCKDCVEVCPGYRTSHVPFDGSLGSIEELQKGWGPILEIWEGYASDPEVRYSGSSGGLASAIALYCLVNKGWDGILHAGVNPRKPWENMTVFSRNRSDIISQTGSRYSPASPCDGLAQIESATGPCMFIGKGCDVAGLRKSQELRSEVEKNTGVVLGIFCAGTPSTRGTIELFEKLNVEAEKIREVRYRGRG